MDPAFDKPPDFKYTCTICNATGKHYKSLCPKNPDPLSIIQRRKLQGLKTSSKVSPSSSRDPAQREELFKICQADRDHARLGREPQSVRSISPTRTRTRTLTNEHPANILRRTETIEQKHRREDVIGMESTYGRLSRKRSLSPSTDRSSTATGLRVERNKFRKTNEAVTETLRSEIKVEDLDNTTQAIDDLLIACGGDSGMRQHDRSFNFQAKVSNPDEIEVDSDHDYVLDISEHDHQPTPDLEASYPGTDHRQVGDVLADSSDEDGEIAINEDQTLPVYMQGQANNKYSEFIRKLIRRRGEMTDIVNKIAKRPNAAMMWRKASERRRESTLTA
jgi:hypothetical protein